MEYEPISLLLAHFPTLKLVNYILLCGALELFMLDDDSFLLVSCKELKILQSFFVFISDLCYRKG
jgi:hypothetical protein